MKRLIPLLALAFLLAACGADEPQVAPAASTTAPTEFRRSVRTIQAEEGALTTERRATVTVEAVQESLVAAGTGGRVAQIVAPEGSTVAQGDVVVQIDDEQLQLQVDSARVAVESARVNLQMAQSASEEGGGQARAGLQTAQLNVQLLQRQYDEAQQLHEAGAIARADLDGLAAQLAQARAALQQAQDSVARSNRAGGEDLELLRLQLVGAETQLAQAEAQLEEAAVRAPFAGTVVTVMVNPGEFTGAGQPVFQLSSSGPKLGRFSVPTEDVPFLMNNYDGITIDYGGRSYPAVLRPTSGVPAQGGRQVTMTAEIQETDVPIPSGAVASFSYELEVARGEVLPSSAIRGGNTLLVEQDGRAEAVTVTVVAEVGGQAVVDGLPDGARVVYPLPADLMPGTALEVID